MHPENQDPIKVIHIISSLGRGGRERQLSIIYKYSDLKRFPTKIIYFNEAEKNYIEEYGLSKDLIRIAGSGFFLRFVSLYKIVREEKPSIIFSWGIPESVLGLLVSLFTRVTFINGSIRHGIRLKKRSHLIRKWLVKASPNVVANSKAGLRVNGIRKGYVLYNGVESKFFNTKGQNEIRESISRLLGPNKHEPILISVANFVPYKDYFSILEALKKVKDSGRRFTYILLGDGPMREQITAMIDAYGLNESTIITGKVNNVGEYLQIADIFIHSSRGEGCSNAILESMAAGLPVIASDTGGTNEIVDDSVGRLFSYQDTDRLTDCITELIDSSELRISLGARSKEKAALSFGTERMMREYYSILLRILKK